MSMKSPLSLGETDAETLERIKLALTIAPDAELSEAVRILRDRGFSDLTIGIELGLDYCAYFDHHPEIEATS